MFIQLRSIRFVLRASIFVLPIISFLMSAYICVHWVGRSTGFSSAENLYLVLFTTMVWSIVAERQEVTSITKVKAENTGLRACFAACSTTYLVDVAAIFLVNELAYSRIFVVLSAVILFGLSVGVRSLLRLLLREFAERQASIGVLIVGSGRFAARAAIRIQRNEFLRCHVVGYVQLPGEEIRVRNAPVLQLKDVEVLEALPIETIVIAVSPEHFSELRRTVSDLAFLCKPIRVMVDVGSGARVRDRVLQLGRLQMLDLDPSPTASMGYFFVKRCFDLIFASVLLIAAALPMLLIALLIKLTSPGPVLFCQQRVGRNGRLFTMYKFRTMRIAPANEGDTRWTTQDDPRRTWLGAILRKTSLDELPQFFNVIKGEMSVVGPRPERPHFVKRFRSEIANYQTRHHLSVGITGWAQVNGLRGDTSIERRVRYDLYYLQHWSLMFDLRIIFLTLWCGLKGRNAY